MENIISKIEIKYRQYEKHPESHKDYYKLRKLFFASSSSNEFKPGRSFEREFKEFFQNQLDKEQREEIEVLKKRVWSSNVSSSSSSESESDNEQTFQALYDKGRKKIKEKYLGYFESPHTNENYALHLELFRKYYGGLKGEMKQIKWRKYWNDAMDDDFDREINEMKENLRRCDNSEAQKIDREQRSKRKKTEVKPEEELVKIKTEPMTSQCFLETIVIEEEDTIPRSKIEKMFENYDLRKDKVTKAIDETFDEYLNNKNFYPFIKDEKKLFLLQQKIVSLNSDQYCQLEDQFDEHWPQRIENLRDKQKKLEVQRIRANWADLVEHPNDVTYDDGCSTKRRLSEIENSPGKFRKTDDGEKLTNHFQLDCADAETQTSFETANKQTETDADQVEVKSNKQNCTKAAESQAAVRLPSTSTAARTETYNHKASKQDLIRHIQGLTPREQFILLQDTKKKAPERYAQIKSYMMINNSEQTFEENSDSILLDSDDESDVEEVKSD